jgi:hypothetical protein
MKTFLLTIYFFFFLTTTFGQGYTIKRDLRPQWLVREGEQFIPFENRDNTSQVIYFRIPVKEFRGEYFQIESLKDCSLFVNNNLVATGKRALLSIDSLATAFSSNTLLVALHQNQIDPENIQTYIAIKNGGVIRDDMLAQREGSSLRDFAILVILVLVIIAVVIVRLNPKLASDYFSITKIFSTREIDDNNIYTRIGSSTNILFYFYCSMLLAYYLIIIFHFVEDRFPIAPHFRADSFIMMIVQWLKLSSIIFLFLFLKIIVVFGISYLFGIAEVAGIHFFNWIRLLLVFFGLLTAVLFIYFLWHGQSGEVHASLLKLTGWITGAWMILIFLKLAGKVRASMFHLFSYICATELIPFLFIIKVLYN